MSNKIFQIVPNTIPRLVQVVNNEFFDGNGNPLNLVGPQGETGLSFSWMGTYATSSTYNYYNIVEYNGSSYIYLGEPAFGVTPSTTTQSWALLASMGATGFQGRTGPQGFQGPTGPNGPTPSLSVVLTQGNTASTSINMMNNHITDLDYIDFYTQSVATLTSGRLWWNDTDGTLNLGLKGGNVNLQIGQENVVRVVNKTGSDLLESQFKVVRVRLSNEGGSQGQRLAVVLAEGNNDPDSATTLGIVTENITNNQEGFITTFGLVNGIDTTATGFHGQSWADGDVLYLSPTVPGGITNVKPNAPDHMVTLGYVVYSHQNNGKIFVKIDNGYELKELHDVYYTTPDDGDILKWNTANSRWQATASTSGGTGSGSQGPQGFQGVTGPQGTGGGSTGSQGSTGPQGDIGPQGLQGYTGPQGLQGLVGPTGTNGTIGVNGETGSQGPQGFEGPTGPTNPAMNLFLFYNY